MRTIVCAALIVCLSTFAEATPLAPKAQDVCTKGPEPTVEPRKLVGALLRGEGIHDLDLDTSGGDVSFETKVAALTNFNTFCTGQCSEQGSSRLNQAGFDLLAFFQENSKPRPAGDGGFQVIPAIGPDFNSAALADYLRGKKSRYRIACFSAPEAPKIAKSEEQKKAEEILSSVRVRNTISDLKISRTKDKQKFAQLTGANASFENNYVTNTQTLSASGVVGYGFDVPELGEYSSAIPFVSYAAKNVTSGKPGGSSKIGNIGAGLLGDFNPVIGSYYQNFQVFGQYVHSYVTDTDLVSANVVYNPDFFFPGVGAAYTPDGSPVAFLLKPQAKLIYGKVVNAGSNPNFATNDFARGGGRIELALFGVWDSLQDFSFNSSYEYLQVWVGAFKSITRWENTLSYTLPDQENWSIQLKYIDGRNLDTFEREKLVMLGVGFKN
jgi:hypothetical protein